MILEGIVVTTNEDGNPNISPMGPLIDDEAISRFLLRPFQTSKTYKNLKRTGVGVLHVTDDVSVFVDGVLRDFDRLPETFQRNTLRGLSLRIAADILSLKLSNSMIPPNEPRSNAKPCFQPNAVRSSVSIERSMQSWRQRF